jgi:hypothetical protein
MVAVPAWVWASGWPRRQAQLIANAQRVAVPARRRRQQQADSV